MKRKAFIKSCGNICVKALVASALASMASCSPIPIHKASENNIIPVPLSRFDAKNLILIYTPWLPYDVLLVRFPNNQFKALWMKCSHQDEALTITRYGIFCPAHGSSFDLNGKALHPPAVDALKDFKVDVKSNVVEIHLI